ncbi:MAG TPA: response regulator [Candidatus Sulfotelmatobacter sp.]|nr:response regulator [Candidatus Sulfotelmatobacter sp.]
MSACPILLAEDDDHDVFFFERALRNAGVAAPLVTVHDGAEAIEYLLGGGPFADRSRFPLPCLVITDLKMPKVSGFDLLDWLQHQSQLSHLPCLVLSSSAHEADIQRSLALGARAYWVKPSDVSALKEIVCELQTRWLSPAPAP